MRAERKRIKQPRIWYKGFHFAQCDECGRDLVFLPDPKKPERMVPVLRYTWEKPVENRSRFYIRRVHRYHYCPARLAALKEKALADSRAARPWWAQSADFDPL